MTTPTLLLANEIRSRMRSQGVDVSAIARATGMSYETARRRVQGQGSMPVTDLFSIAKALGTTPEVLITAANEAAKP